MHVHDLYYIHMPRSSGSTQESNSAIYNWIIHIQIHLSVSFFFFLEGSLALLHTDRADSWLDFATNILYAKCTHNIMSITLSNRILHPTWFLFSPSPKRRNGQWFSLLIINFQAVCLILHSSTYTDWVLNLTILFFHVTFYIHSFNLFKWICFR